MSILDAKKELRKELLKKNSKEKVDEYLSTLMSYTMKGQFLTAAQIEQIMNNVGINR